MSKRSTRSTVSHRRIECTSSSEEADDDVTVNPPRVRREGVRVHPDYKGRGVSVPGSYFNLDDGVMCGGKAGRWGRYRSTRGTYNYGYYIHFDEGDKYWMIENDVHKYLE